MNSTGNDLESNDILDFEDNTVNLDILMNADQEYWTDRLGNKRPTIDYALRMAGFTPAGFDFATGGILGNGDRNKCVFNQADQTWYSWSGNLPYNVIAGSEPGEGWKVVNRNALTIAREALRRTYLEVGYNLVEGSFEQGAELVNATDVVLQERTGKVFSGPAGTVTAGTNPASGGFVDKSGELLRSPALAGIYRDWKANLAERGINLVAGSFEEGATTTKPNDAVMYYATGTPYLLKSGANADVPAGDAPNSDWTPVRLIEPLQIITNSKVAHRCLTPENTILALGSCRRSGFDAVETDAKQSADGVWYIFHDDTVDNLTTGTGTFSALSSSYINTLRFDSLAGGKYAAEPIPLVTDFLKAALIKGLTVYLEIKSYLTYADIDSLVSTVEGLNAGNGVVICSMDITVLRYIRFTLNSDVALQYVYEGTDYIGAINAALSLQRISFSYFNNYVRQYPAVVGVCAKAGLSLFAWTILNKKTADQCTRIGATNLVTDIVL